MSAPVYRWVPGMRALNQHGDRVGIVTHVAAGAADCTRLSFGAWQRTDERLSPDLDHGPTRGALLDQVRELSGDTSASSFDYVNAWAVRGRQHGKPKDWGTGDTEDAAIMDALERLAPKVAAAEPTGVQLDAIGDLAAQRDALARVVNRIRTLFDLDTISVPARRYDEAALDETIEAVRTAARNADRLEAIERRHAEELRRVLVTHADMRRQLDAALAERDTMRRKLADAQLDDPRETLETYSWQTDNGVIWTRAADVVTVERGVVTVATISALVSDELRALAAIADEQMESNS